MEKVYLLVGDSAYLVNQHIKYYKTESNIDPFNILVYDAEELNINDLIQELYTVSLFSENKMVVLINVESLVGHSKEQLNEVIKYIENPSSEIIFVLAAKLLDQSHPLYDVLEKHAYIETIKTIEQSALPIYIKENFEKDGYEIDGAGILELISRSQPDLYSLHQEIEKLKLYTIDEKKVGKLEVELLVSRTLEDNIFNFSTAYLKGDVRSYMSIYEDLMQAKMATNTIFNHLYQTVSFIYQAQNLIKQGKNQEVIANTLGISTGRAYYVMKEAKEQNKKRIEKTIKDLAKLDVLIKSGRQEDKLGFELLLLGNLK